MIARRAGLAALTAICCAVPVSAALAARAPTARELRGIARVNDIPGQCLYVRVSTLDRHYARVSFRAPPSSLCQPYVANGEAVVHFGRYRWHTVLAFSSDISCPVKAVPIAVARELKVCP